MSLAISDRIWQFYIDVGGTFTDCLARGPDERLHFLKVLSSGAVKGRAARGSGAASIVEPRLRGMPAQFYRGFSLVLLDKSGAPLESSRVAGYDSAAGRFTLEKALRGVVGPGVNFELRSGEPPPLLAIRSIMGLRLDEPVGKVRIFLGTTAGTNALLERKGAAAAFVTTRGFADVLRIGTQQRPELFRLHIKKPEMLYRTVVELDERVDAHGRVLLPLSEEAVESALQPLPKRGITSLAICLLNAIWHPAHEEMVAAVARRLGFRHISVSHRLTATIKFLERGDTSMVDAYLSPVIRAYAQGLLAALPAAELKLMTSAGGLVEAQRFSGKDSILSGPAGGVVGFARAAQQAGFGRAIGFDMGGTSTDVSRFDGEYEYQFATEKAGVRIVAPMLAIETVAAGGGSICRYNQQRLLVGPQSAGADPGPACYGRGGPLTITDINLFHGKIDERHFPFRLDKRAVRSRLNAIRREILRAEGRRMSLAEIADGFTRVANLKMAAAIKRISAAKGYDPADYVLVAFGGAAAQHAGAIARQLGIGKILLHPLGGILSAFGMANADVRRFADRSVLKPLNAETLRALEGTFRTLEARLLAEVRDEGIPPDRIAPPLRYFELRYRGEESTLLVQQEPAGPTGLTPQPPETALAAEFARRHQMHYGYAHQSRPIEVAAIRVEVRGAAEKLVWHPQSPAGKSPARPRRRDGKHPHPVPERFITTYFDAEPHRTAVFSRKTLPAGVRLTGPAIICEDYSTIVLDPGWSAEVCRDGNLLLRDGAELSTPARRTMRSRRLPAERDPVRLELFNNHFTHIATQMGLTLQKTALSTNVKERLDYSCAILDADGELVVNAPHIPVHLGAMSESVKGLLREVTDLQPGDVYLSNDPGLGGSHLPDLTVMTPVFDPRGQALRFFAASRAHHAEIGGVRPGSAYPFAQNLAEEGVVLRNLRIVRGGQFQESALRAALTGGPYPSRAPEENIADIRAAIAANQAGSRQLLRLIDVHTWQVVRQYMRYIREAAAEKVIAALQKIGEGRYHFSDALDDGAPVKVSLEIRRNRLRIDFSGSAPVNPNSLNATPAVVQAAVMYCLRCLIDEDIPLNAGLMAPVELVVPEGMLNPPTQGDPARRAAVFGGNVEISQRLVDVIFGALGVVAAGQGTMNNVVFGNPKFGYYETICGGSGAGPGFPGASAVQVHMTNTRLTDVEILERRYPVRIRQFRIRRGSGGRGQWCGGDGVIREIEFLAPVEVSLLTQRRERPPFGLAGGMPGAPGENWLHRKGKRRPQPLGPLAQLQVQPGDRIVILTPGGGGYGSIARTGNSHNFT